MLNVAIPEVKRFGSIEEYFISQLEPADAFVCRQTTELVRVIHDGPGKDTKTQCPHPILYGRSGCLWALRCRRCWGMKWISFRRAGRGAWTASLIPLETQQTKILVPSPMSFGGIFPFWRRFSPSCFIPSKVETYTGLRLIAKRLSSQAHYVFSGYERLWLWVAEW